jgi:hypothetical protein
MTLLIAVAGVRHPRAEFEPIPRDLSRTELLRYFTYSENDLWIAVTCIKVELL